MPEIKLLGCMTYVSVVVYLVYCTVNKHTKHKSDYLFPVFYFLILCPGTITIFKHVIMHGIFMHQSYQIQKGYMFYGFARVWVQGNFLFWEST